MLKFKKYLEAWYISILNQPTFSDLNSVYYYA